MCNLPREVVREALRAAVWNNDAFWEAYDSVRSDAIRALLTRQDAPAAKEPSDHGANH